MSWLLGGRVMPGTAHCIDFNLGKENLFNLSFWSLRPVYWAGSCQPTADFSTDSISHKAYSGLNPNPSPPSGGTLCTQASPAQGSLQPRVGSSGVPWNHQIYWPVPATSLPSKLWSQCTGQNNSDNDLSLSVRRGVVVVVVVSEYWTAREVVGWW